MKNTELKIWNNIRKFRIKRGYYSCSELCRQLCLWGYECTPTLVRLWERKRRNPSIFAVQALCEILDVSADDLLF